jgi:hypothetical protein
MKVATTILILSFAVYGHAQTELPQKIRISKGECASPCGYENGFHDIEFKYQLEYRLADSVFSFRKKLTKNFKELTAINSKIFTDSTNYYLLDSLFQNFTDFKSSPGKYYIYKIELIYCKSSTGLPIKTKTMDFLITTNPNKIHPEFIDSLIDDYHSIIRNNL